MMTPAYLATAWVARTSSACHVGAAGDGDDGIAERPRALLERQAAQLRERGEVGGEARGARVEDDVLDAGAA